MKSSLILVLVFLSLFTARAQENSFFPNLTKVSIDTTYDVFFGYDKTTCRLINKPCWLFDKTDPFYCKEDEVLATWILVAKFKSPNLKDSVNIVYSDGMSADPGFTIANKEDKWIGDFACTELYINAAGTIYTSGHINNMYNRRRKFQLQNDTVTEIRQPYYYVGLKGKTLKAITLYREKIGNDIVAQLPKGYEIEILLAESDTKDYRIDYNFMVKTEFGLVGWLRLINDDIYGQVLEGLFYKGD